MDRLLHYVFAGSRGGPTRIRIVQLLLERPLNANQLARRLHLDYKTVEYNLRVLLKQVLVVSPEPDRYGALYQPSKNLLAALATFHRIAASVQPPPGPKEETEMGKPTNSAEPRGAVR